MNEVRRVRIDCGLAQIAAISEALHMLLAARTGLLAAGQHLIASMSKAPSNI